LVDRKVDASGFAYRCRIVEHRIGDVPHHGRGRRAGKWRRQPGTSRKSTEQRRRPGNRR
jgi:hypothetical protein